MFSQNSRPHCDWSFFHCKKPLMVADLTAQPGSKLEKNAVLRCVQRASMRPGGLTSLSRCHWNLSVTTSAEIFSEPAQLLTAPHFGLRRLRLLSLVDEHRQANRRPAQRPKSTASSSPGPAGSQTQSRATSIGSVKNWVRSFISPANDSGSPKFGQAAVLELVTHRWASRVCHAPRAMLSW